MSAVFDRTVCELGEGPLWHPGRGQLYWFDILGKRLLTNEHGATRHWQFDENVSAAGWISRDELLIASETALFRFDLETGARENVVPLEADRAETRSNDGRADPWGGFWIGTMGKNAEPGFGAIYRLFRGELRQLFAPVTISNAICFTPDRKYAHFTDTRTGIVQRVELDADGWPKGEAETFIDLRSEGLNPDGAIVDADGNLWLAEWGAARVAVHDGEGRFLRAVAFDAPHTSCPAFGGPDLTTLFCTTALQGMDETARARFPDAGKTFAAVGAGQGQKEHQVIL